MLRFIWNIVIWKYKKIHLTNQIFGVIFSIISGFLNGWKIGLVYFLVFISVVVVNELALKAHWHYREMRNPGEFLIDRGIMDFSPDVCRRWIYISQSIHILIVIMANVILCYLLLLDLRWPHLFGQLGGAVKVYFGY